MGFFVFLEIKLRTIFWAATMSVGCPGPLLSPKPEHKEVNDIWRSHSREKTKPYTRCHHLRAVGQVQYCSWQWGYDTHIFFVSTQFISTLGSVSSKNKHIAKHMPRLRFGQNLLTFSLFSLFSSFFLKNLFFLFSYD